jgi:predicted RND superfamily exporter protein
MTSKPTLTDRLESFFFGNRRLVIGLFLLATVLMVWAGTRLRVDAGFTKQLPLQHPYMATFLKHQQEFGGANRVLVALVARDGNMFTPEFFDTLKRATDEVFFLPGVDRGRVQSLFTPNVRYTEVIEDGIAAGNVIPDDFETSPQGLEKVRRNILKAGIVGRLVANDFSGALISAELMEVDPTTGKKLDVIALSKLFETKVREKFDADFVPGSPVDVHILGFAKVIGDVAAGAGRVVLFFLVTFFITGLLVYLYSQSHWLSAVVLTCSAMAVAWQLGIIKLLGFGMDPMSILVPFLIFAIAVSHGVQMVSANGAEVFDGFERSPSLLLTGWEVSADGSEIVNASDSLVAARNSFRKLLVPGGIALATCTIGFFTILFIKIRVIQEIAIAASIGVAAISLTNLVLLPVLLSYFRIDEAYRLKIHLRARRMERIWRSFSRVTERGPATVIIVVAVLLGVFGAWKGHKVQVGDLHRGVPELRADSRYNTDTAIVTSKFSIGVDIINVIAETKSGGCVDHAVMSTIDAFTWHMANVPGIQSTVELSGIAKTLNAGWNEGSPKWRVLARNQSVLQQSVTYVPTTSGLLNSDCSVMPVMLFTTDHKAETIQRIVAAVKEFESRHGNSDVHFRLATGNVGVMAATNEAVYAAQFPIMGWVFGSVILLCLVTFRSIRGMLCILVPLFLVSLLAHALMAMLDIGLKVSTLPVAALGVGVGVDYGIYLYSRFRAFYRDGDSLRDAYFKTLEVTGNGVLFTGITLAVGVATWLFSPLKFQADMGLLLAFLFLMNMVGALVVIPALAHFLLPEKNRLKA